MAKDPNPPAGTPPVPAAPLLPPVPSMLNPVTSTSPSAPPKRELIDTLKPASREERDMRQMAKQSIDESANLLVQMQHTQARLHAIVTRGEDAKNAELFAREGLTVAAAKRLNQALITVLDEFMPVK